MRRIVLLIMIVLVCRCAYGSAEPSAGEYNPQLQLSGITLLDQYADIKDKVGAPLYEYIPKKGSRGLMIAYFGKDKDNYADLTIVTFQRVAV